MARHRLATVTAVLAATAIVLAGCGGTTSSPSAGPTPSHPPSSRATNPESQHTERASPSHSSTSAAAAPSGATKLLVFVVENHSLSQMRSQMAWTYALGQQYGYATDFHAMTHPSLPNYLAIAGGSTFGVQDDDDPSAHPISGPSAFGEALAHGRSARVYADAMPAPCTTTNAGEYAVRHNPWTYFTSERPDCQSFDTPLDRFRTDVSTGQLPDAGMVVPDVCHDAHDCSLATADAWMKQEIGLAMSGPDFRSGRLAIVVTADEDDGSQGNVVLTIVVHPSVRGMVATSPLSHLSLSKLYTQVLGLPPLREAASAPSMAEAFGLALGR
jgi:phosphatidylinositol-3-phosphatase